MASGDHERRKMVAAGNTSENWQLNVSAFGLLSRLTKRVAGFLMAFSSWTFIVLVPLGRRLGGVGVS